MIVQKNSAIRARFLAAFGLVALSVLIVGYMAREYRTNSNFRADVKTLMFQLSVSDSDRKLLLLGDSRIASMSCADDFSGWRLLNLGIPGSTAVDWETFTRSSHLNHYGAVVLWVGINDILTFGRTGTSVAASVLRIIRNLTPVSQNIALINPKDAPTSGNSDLSQRADWEGRLLAKTLASELRMNGSLVTPFYSEPNANLAEFYVDPIHLNERGYRILCAELGRWLANHG
jgi:hypothetical protein